MTRSKTDRLRKAEKNGATIVSTDDGTPVTYSSKGPRDDKPWVKNGTTERRSGTDCQATVQS